MKKNEKDSLFLLGGIAALIVGFILSGMLIHAPKTGSVKVNNVPPIPGNFPDVKNDKMYSNYLNQNALDPTQAIQLGNSNSTPFNASE